MTVHGFQDAAAPGRGSVFRRCDVPLTPAAPGSQRTANRRRGLGAVPHRRAARVRLRARVGESAGPPSTTAWPLPSCSTREKVQMIWARAKAGRSLGRSLSRSTVSGSSPTGPVTARSSGTALVKPAACSSSSGSFWSSVSSAVASATRSVPAVVTSTGRGTASTRVPHTRYTSVAAATAVPGTVPAPVSIAVSQLAREGAGPASTGTLVERMPQPAVAASARQAARRAGPVRRVPRVMCRAPSPGRPASPDGSARRCCRRSRRRPRCRRPRRSHRRRRRRRPPAPRAAAAA